ncbi:MAG: DNA protecting protein DprA [Zetaproteobacteria bacterium CG1_02_53_45]|nr:MAG: DNA protecting protein DprA [Zetaproteobacteria bacterium CG1_02_53_45]
MDHLSSIASERGQLWLRLAMLRGVGPMLGRRLVTELGGIDQIWSMDATRLKSVDGVGPKLLAVLAGGHAVNIDPVLCECEARGIRLLCPDDESWPAMLYGIDDAPLVLFVQGDITALNTAKPIAMVGARRASREGQVISRSWSRYFSDQGMTVISGMAYGIDAAAHGGALSGSSPTIAVLGCGLAGTTEEQQLQVAAICRQGCVVSEFLPDVSARPEYFPRRNRIIAALARATLVMEADVRSGSMITARQALEYGRELFAVPGSVLLRNHDGCHQLIRDGATLISKPAQLLQHMNWEGGGRISAAGKKTYAPANALEAKVMAALGSQSMHLDTLCETCGLTLPELSPILLALELQDVIKRLPGNRYILSVELSES